MFLSIGVTFFARIPPTHGASPRLELKTQQPGALWKACMKAFRFLDLVPAAHSSVPVADRLCVCVCVCVVQREEGTGSSGLLCFTKGLLSNVCPHQATEKRILSSILYLDIFVICCSGFDGFFFPKSQHLFWDQSGNNLCSLNGFKQDCRIAL